MTIIDKKEIHLASLLKCLIITNMNTLHAGVILVKW